MMRRRENVVRKSAVVLGVLTMIVLAGCQSPLKSEKTAKGDSDEGSQLQTESQGEIVGREEAGSAGENGGTNMIERNGTESAGTNGTDVSKEPGEEMDPAGQSDLAQAEDSQSVGMPESLKPAGGKQRPEGWELTLAKEDWGLSFGEPGTQSVGNASAQDLAWYDAYYVGDDSEKVIYLTFDCGYENGNTEPILDALKKHDVQATFFVVGHFLETAPDMAKRMVAEGHAVGNHTYHHPDMLTISDLDSFRKELDDVANLFREITGTSLYPYYRAPQGKCNVENLKMAQELGYYTIFWSLAYVDWNQDSQPTHEEAFDKLTRRIHPGAVVLLHNTSQTNGEILDELLTKWEEMGYTFKPLSDLVSDS